GESKNVVIVDQLSSQPFVRRGFFDRNECASVVRVARAWAGVGDREIFFNPPPPAGEWLEEGKIARKGNYKRFNFIKILQTLFVIPPSAFGTLFASLTLRVVGEANAQMLSHLSSRKRGKGLLGEGFF
ncbi:hypothetical protein KZ442_09135, partial [Glaesserella parasuis]|nr:hypothetical protein [Glaesserella parasuis]